MFRLFSKKRMIFGLSERDIIHHLVLGLVLLFGVWIFAAVSYSRILQFIAGVVTALAYVAWGIIHHRLDGDLYFKNVIEYVFIALLAIVILGGIFL